MSDDKKQNVIRKLDYIREAIAAVIWIIFMINPNVFNNLVSGVILSCLVLLSAFWSGVREKIPHDKRKERIRKNVTNIMIVLMVIRILVEIAVEFEVL